MGSKLEACAECTLNCLQDHGNKKKASTVVASFFKIMIGDQLSKVLFLPPKFAPTVSALVNKKAVLEDSRGRQWKVTISRVDGSLAFQQGWNAFALDNDLQVGEFLIFNYVTDSHFDVMIYDKSGCEKLKFSEAMNQKKWTWDNQNSSIKDGPCHTVDNSLMDKQGSSTSLMSDADEDIGQDLDPMNAKRKAPMVMGNASKCDNSHERSKIKLKEPDRDIGQHLYDMNSKRKAPMVMGNASNRDNSHERSKLKRKKPDGDVGQDLYGMNAKMKAPVVTGNASNCDNSHERSKLKLKEPDGDIGQHVYGMNAKRKAPVVTRNALCDNSHERSKYKLKEPDGDISQDLYGMNAKTKAPVVTKNASNCDNSHKRSKLKLKESDGDIDQHLYDMNDKGECTIATENASNYDDSNEMAKLKPKEEYIEDMICMIDRELGDKQEDNRSCIYDSLNFELFELKSGTGGSNEVVVWDETCSHHDDSSVRLRNEAGSVDKNPVAKEAVAAAFPMDETYSPHDDSSLRLRNEAGSVDKSPVAKEAVTAAIPMDETCSCHDDSSLRLRGDASLVDKAPVAREAVAIAIPLDAYKFDGTEKNNSSEARVKKVSPSGDDSRTTNKISHHLFPTAAVNPNDTGNKVAASKKEHDLIDDSFQRAKENFTGTPLESFDMMMKAVKKESVDLTSDPCFQKIIPEIDGKSFEPVDAVCSQISNMIKREKDIAFPVPVVKSEPVDQVETFPSSSFSCLVAVGSQSFLELPVRLPIRMTIRGRHTPDRRVIFLRDTTMRLWPVLYIDNCFSKILSSGWEAFSKANNIQPGDTCAIGIEDASERICSVHIIRT
ncbi:B3 domain-containing protein [Pyrus ussuriensis x Pyrus communis]|uniref:B3 domain-containing protein n=1 Tax=Pyrus ussuriensis x Pyrus communis TaxID=2448454 RepID=A0A5N5HZ85_9ROSA|nr:B3 domain-containing protein [Pyrus ussuriensis x Pyrus communis]